MYNDTEIQRDIVAALKWDPSLRDDDIAVGMRDGIVTLAGFADSYADKWKAEQVAAKVKGVRAVANDIDVRLPSNSERPDPEIARAALDALQWNVSVPQDRIQVRAENGWLTLDGDVEWYFQKEAAERAVRYIRGVKGVSNLITLRVRSTPADIKQKIKEALQRGALVDADRITVAVDGSKVSLYGTVHSYAEMNEAMRAARSAPGVTEVESHITIDPSVHAGV